MHCPKCRNEVLKPAKLEEGLPAMGCPACDGALLSLLYYRDWAERATLPSPEQTANELSDEQDAKAALCCPKCSRIMTKYSIAGSVDTRLDLCGNCDEAWLDGGEWSTLKALELAQKLPAVFSDQWQRRVRMERTELDRVERLTRLVGHADAEKAVDVKKWLASTANRAQILHFLSIE